MPKGQGKRKSSNGKFSRKRPKICDAAAPNLDALLQEGLVLEGTDPKGAMAKYQAILEVQADHGEALLQAGLVYKGWNKRDKAKACLSGAIDKALEVVQDRLWLNDETSRRFHAAGCAAQYNLALILSQEGEHAEADATLVRCLAPRADMI